MNNFSRVFIQPILRTLVQPFWGAIASGLGGLLGGRGSRPKPIDLDQIREFQQPTQDLVDRQLSMAEEHIDPGSDINLQLKKFLAQKAAESGAQAGSQSMKIAAMRGVNPAQAMMASQFGTVGAMGNVNQQWLQALMNQRYKGMGQMQNMTQVQQQLGDNLANVSMANTDMSNRNPYNPAASFMTALGNQLG